MKNQLLQIPAVISKIQSMANKVLRLQIDTQENLTSEQMVKIIDNFDKFGYFCFLIEKRIEPKEIEIPDIKPEFKNDKSPSQRLRNVLWILWEQNGKKGEFDIYYKSQIEKIIETIKNKLN